MAQAASEYQDDFNCGKSIRKAVITVPQYLWEDTKPSPLISCAIEGAKLANIKIIDIIEETHADLLYYISSWRYAEMIKPGVKVAILDIGGGTCVCKVYEISENEGKRYAVRFMESNWHDDSNNRFSGRYIDDVIIRNLEESIPEKLRNDMKLRTLEAAKKIKHNLSFEEKIEFDFSEIHPHLKKIIEFTREHFEGKLKSKSAFSLLQSRKYEEFPLLLDMIHYSHEQYLSKKVRPPFNDVNIVFLAGGTCRIPCVQKQISDQFPKAKIVIDGQLEIITATGAAIHALQVLSGEVQPYIKINEESSTLNEKVMTDQNEVDTSYRSEVAPDERIKITTHVINSQSQSEAESYIQSFEKEDNNPCYPSAEKETVIEGNLTVNISERNQQHNETDLDSSQVEVLSKEKSLLP